MKSFFSRSRQPNFSVRVKTGDRFGAGTDANVKIILKDSNGNETEELTLDNFFRDDFECGQLDIFKVITSNSFGNEIAEIEFWRDNAGVGSNWYVDTILIQNEKTHDTYVFPIYRWIKAHHHYIIRHLDTSLPQFDPHWKQREMELEDKIQNYQIIQKIQNGPAQVKDLPNDEHFSFDYKWNILKKKWKMVATCKLDMLMKGANWESLSCITKVYSDALGVPTGIHTWKSDIYFGLQRIANMNHSLIELCTAIPEKLGVTEDALRPFLEGLSVQQVIEKNRLFIVDLKILEGIPTKSDEYILTIPIALFFINSKKQLLPIAIQLFQEKGNDNPVFFPTDPPNTWLMAKMWYNLADSSYHQSLTHLGFTHLLMEGVDIVTNRQLSQSHPIYKLLAPHFLYLLAINSKALETLITPNGWIDKTLTIGIKGLFALIAKGVNMWRLDSHGTLPEDLKRRGLSDPDILPGYHFRDDALLFYETINTYVTKYVKLYYDTPEKIFDDVEIMSWGNELAKPREEGGCGLLGIPRNGKFATAEDLILTLTSIIYTCSVGHGSTNFPQYDEYAFPPNYPASMKGVPPKDKTPLTDEDILISLPDKPTTLDIITITKLLSDKGTNSLGDFEVQYIFDPPAKKIVNEFRADLKQIREIINVRNKTRDPPYMWLDPDTVPNSISI